MHSPQELITLYDKRFSGDNFNQTPSGLYNPVNHIMNIKGKRIRPLLLLMSCDMFGGQIHSALNPAFAMEVFHNFTLVHDDIMDKSEIRRGFPTVHKMFGINTGILAGDVMLAYAYKYLTDIAPAFIPQLLAIFNKTAIEIFEGQQMDMEFEQRLDVNEDDYLKMIEYKTSVLLGCCLQLGAVVAGASPKDQEWAYDFGMRLGLSFQIKDDYLDTFGEGEKVGKRIGGDILQNKKTHLFVSAWNMADGKTKEKLSNLLNEKNEEKKISEMKRLYEELGAQQHSLQKADELYLKALESLQLVSVKEESKEALKELAGRINSREF